MSTLTPIHRTQAPSKPHVISAIARWGYHLVQTIWLVAMVVTAIAAGHTLGYIVLWALGAGIIATLDFGYREFVLHDHPSSSS
jgi:hypothetical protein